MMKRHLLLVMSLFLMAGNFACKKKKEAEVEVEQKSSNAAPSVQISLNEEVVVEQSLSNARPAGYTISATATASDSDGSIVKVEFFLNDASVAVDSTAPYELNVNTLQVSDNTVYAIAHDNGGANTKSNVITKSFVEAL